MMLEYAILISGSMCLIIGILLLAVTSYPQDGNFTYRRVKRFLAFSAFLEVFKDAFLLFYIDMGDNPYVLDQFLVPMVYYVQLFLMTMALLGLLHSSSVLTPYMQLVVFSPLIVILPLHFTSYIIYTSGVDLWTRASYIAFLSTRVSVILGQLIQMVLLMELSICTYVVVRESRSYRIKLADFFSGNEVENGARLSYMVNAYLLFFVMAILNIMIHDQVFDAIYITVNLCLFVSFSIVVFNLRPLIDKISPAVEYGTNADKKSTVNVFENVQSRESCTMSARIEAWIGRSDKPFLKDSLTLSSVADDLRVTPRLLSEFLNKIYQKNFNQWVNELRVEEVKHLLVEKSQLSLTEIAFMAGFADLSTMSRTFKHITGNTPSYYKFKN